MEENMLDRRNRVINLGADAIVKATGLDLSPEVSDARYWEIGRDLYILERGVQWALGDWYAFGRQRYNDQIELKAGQVFGRALHTIQNYAAVCHAVPRSRRREDVSFSHHEAVVGLPAEIQEQLLSSAVKHHVPVQELRDTVRKLKEEMEEGRRASARDEPFPIPTRYKLEVEHRTIELRGRSMDEAAAARRPSSDVVRSAAEHLLPSNAVKSTSDSEAIPPTGAASRTVSDPQRYRDEIHAPLLRVITLGSDGEAKQLSAMLGWLGVGEREYLPVCDATMADLMRQLRAATERRLASIEPGQETTRH
jgi:hypothetical protein